MTIPTKLPSGWLSAIALLLLLPLVGCGTFEDKRIRQLYHEKGFGSRAHGDATQENYLGGLDKVQFLIEPQVLAQEGLERLAELTVPQPVGIDGTLFVPYVGPVYALGLTEADLGALVTSHLRSLFKNVQVQARIVENNKVFYAFGEVRRKGRIKLETDMTLWDAMMVVEWTNLANLGRVTLIRPDAEHPLVIDVNCREMFTTGATGPNFRLRERDAIHVPPTVLGMLARVLERLLDPVALAVRTAIGAAQVQVSYDVLSGNRNAGFFRF
ncbi:MAG: polysaccharide biosynthesis/export family protein [Planctomycetes bacterium]|nr:polysaccharide biosynthesis/export family protein [Planctomycetota bacterium]